MAGWAGPGPQDPQAWLCFFTFALIGEPVILSSRPFPSSDLPDWPLRWPVTAALILPLAACLLVTIPVFLQAPWVRTAPMQAALFTAPLLAVGVLLEFYGRGVWQPLGALMVGFCGSWLGGTLFWGWCRLHPIWHLPIEAFALPLALAGLGTRWRLAGSFYLAALLGTAATDGVMAITGLMDLWPQALAAPLHEAPLILQHAAQRALQPLPLTVILVSAILLLAICRSLWGRGGPWRVASATLGTTLIVDGLFLMAALLAPQLSGMT